MYAGRCEIKHTVFVVFQSTQNEKLWAYAKYLYDGFGERIRLRELGTYENKSFTYDVLLLFKEVKKENCYSRGT